MKATEVNVRIPGIDLTDRFEGVVHFETQSGKSYDAYFWGADFTIGDERIIELAELSCGFSWEAPCSRNAKGDKIGRDGCHGFKLGEYREWGKHTNFELDARVPLLLSYPGMKQPGKKTNGIVELVDVYPSLCELAGLPVPNGLEGTSFVPLLKNPEKSWKPAAFSQHTREFYKRDQYPNRDVMGYSVRTDRYRFTRWQRGPAGKPGEVIATELYDYQKGPREKVNLAGDPAYAALVREMTVLLEKGGSAALPE